AWSSLFLGNLGVRLAQLKLISQILRTAPLEGGPPGCGLTRERGFRKRIDNGYSISGGAYPMDIVPDTFRFMRDFRNSLRHLNRNVRPRLGWRFLQELAMKRNWRHDQRTPFED